MPEGGIVTVVLEGTCAPCVIVMNIAVVVDEDEDEDEDVVGAGVRTRMVPGSFFPLGGIVIVVNSDMEPCPVVVT